MDSCMSPEEEARYRRSFRTGIPRSRVRSSSFPRQSRPLAEEKLNRSYEAQKSSPRNNNDSFSRSPISPKLFKCKVYTPDGVELNTTFTVIQNETDLNNTYIIPAPYNIFSSSPQSDLNTTFTIPKGDLNTTFSIPQGDLNTTFTVSPDCEGHKRTESVPRNISPLPRQPQQLSPQPGPSGICRNRTISAPSPTIWAVPEGRAPKCKQNPNISQTKSGSVRPGVQSRGRKPIPINERPAWVGFQSCEQSEFPTSQSFSRSPRKSVPLTKSREIRPSSEEGNSRACQGPVRLSHYHPSSPTKAASYPSNYEHSQEYVSSFYNTRGVKDDITANYIQGASTDLGYESLEPQFTDKTKPPFPEWYTPGVRWNFKKEVYEPIYQVETERGPHISARFKHLQVAGRVNDPEVTSEAERQLEEQLFHGFRHLYAPYPNPEEKARKMTTQPRKSWNKCEASEYASQNLPCQPRKRWASKGSSPQYASQRESPKSLLHQVQSANVRRCPPPFKRAPLEPQYHDRSKPPAPEWETANVRWNPATGAYEPIYEVETERGPHISARFKHLQVAGRNDDPETTSEAERQLEEQLFHGFRYLYAPYPVAGQRAPANPPAQPQQHCRRGTWSKSREEPQYAVKTPSPPRRRKWGNQLSDKKKPSFEVPSWVRNAQIQKDLPRGSLPSWAENRDPCLEDEDEESEEANDCYEDKAIPSWAKQVTINRMDSCVDEKEIGLTKMHLSGSQRIHPGALSYLTGLPQWIRKQNGEKEYLEKLPSWVHKAHSSDVIGNKQLLGGIGHEVYISDIEQVWPPKSSYSPSGNRNVERARCAQGLPQSRAIPLRTMQKSRLPMNSPLADTSRRVPHRPILKVSKIPCSKYKMYQLLKRQEKECSLNKKAANIPKNNIKRRYPNEAWEDPLGWKYSFLDDNIPQKGTPHKISNVNLEPRNIHVMHVSSSQYPQAKNPFTTSLNTQCSTLPSRLGAIQDPPTRCNPLPSGNLSQNTSRNIPQCRRTSQIQTPQLPSYSSIQRPSNVSQRPTIQPSKLPMGDSLSCSGSGIPRHSILKGSKLQTTNAMPQQSICQLSRPSFISPKPSSPYGMDQCSSQGKSRPSVCFPVENMTKQSSEFQTSKVPKDTNMSDMTPQRSISKKIFKPEEDSLLQKSLKAEILNSIMQSSKLPLKPSSSGMISQRSSSRTCTHEVLSQQRSSSSGMPQRVSFPQPPTCLQQAGKSKGTPQNTSSSKRLPLPNPSQPLQLSLQFSKLSIRGGSCRNLNAKQEKCRIEEVPIEQVLVPLPKKKKKCLKSEKPHAAVIKKLNCNGKKLLNNLIKSPIQEYDKIMSFITNINAAVDEEDICGIEATDNEDECETANIFQFKDGDNFLIFIKEKHLLQGISFSKIAADLIVAQHIKKICKKMEEDKMRACCEETINDKLTSNMLKTQIVEEFKQSDNMIEVVGYVGCTGVSDDAQNTTESKVKECDENDEEEETKEPSTAEEAKEENQNEENENQNENDENQNESDE